MDLLPEAESHFSIQIDSSVHADKEGDSAQSTLNSQQQRPGRRKVPAELFFRSLYPQSTQAERLGARQTHC